MRGVRVLAAASALACAASLTACGGSSGKPSKAAVEVGIAQSVIVPDTGSVEITKKLVTDFARCVVDETYDQLSVEALELFAKKDPYPEFSATDEDILWAAEEKCERKVMGDYPIAEPTYEPTEKPTKKSATSSSEPSVTIDEAIVSVDTTGKDVVTVVFTWTNTTGDTDNFSWHATVKVFQNGIELNSAWADEDNDQEGFAETYSNVKPGTTVRVRESYELRDRSDITVEVSEYSPTGDGPTSERTFSLK